MTHFGAASEVKRPRIKVKSSLLCSWPRGRRPHQVSAQSVERFRRSSPNTHTYTVLIQLFNCNIDKCFGSFGTVRPKICRLSHYLRFSHTVVFLGIFQFFLIFFQIFPNFSRNVHFFHNLSFFSRILPTLSEFPKICRNFKNNFPFSHKYLGTFQIVQSETLSFIKCPFLSI